MSGQHYEAAYLQGVEHFNAHDFFEAHEVWEDIWKRTADPQRLFYKGMIHAAVTLHHFGNGNIHGARKVLASCTRYLEPYAPQYLGLNVSRFLEELRACCAGLENPDMLAETAKLDRTRIPNIRLDPLPDSTVTEG